MNPSKDTPQERDGLVHLDPDKLARQLRRLGLTKTALAGKTGLSRSTVIKATRGEGIFPDSAQRISQSLGFEDAESLMPTPAADKEPMTGVDAEAVGGQWQPIEYLGPWITASNGLQFRVCRLQHCFVPGRQGRGKWYDLLHLSTQERQAHREHLLRHPVVCDRIGTHAHIVDNLSTSPGPQDHAWWVVDRWLGNETLAKRLPPGGTGIPLDQLGRLMYEIALGLEALHAADIVFRELAPSHILLSDDGRTVLTDFELAKLLDGSPTVSRDWPEDEYRALEVDGGVVDVRADLFSWARILVHAATGSLPGKGRETDALTRVGLPKAVWRVAVDCLSPGPGGRPGSIQQILPSLQKWAASCTRSKGSPQHE